MKNRTTLITATVIALACLSGDTWQATRIRFKALARTVLDCVLSARMKPHPHQTVFNHGASSSSSEPSKMELI